MRAFEISSVLEVFTGYSRRAVPQPNIHYISPDGGEVVLEGEFRHNTERLRPVAGDEILVVPGFDCPATLVEDLQAGRLDSVVRLVGSAHHAGAEIAALSTGVFVLAAAGIIGNTPVTTHWTTSDLLRTHYPRVQVKPNVLYTHDPERRLWSSAGFAASIDLSLALLTAHQGSARAATAARRLIIPAGRHATQAQFVPARHRSAENMGDEFYRLQQAIRANLSQAWTIADLAAITNMTARTLQRRFRAQRGMTPIEWLILERVAVARELLETSQLSVTQISHHVGFGRPDLMRRHFTRVIGMSPSQYRKRHSGSFAPDPDGGII